ncbi:AI-2E family transporter [Glaciihabitans sp. dw_435]|uniref:AI-2E family transporter n=1 Tax=Glaciihabitans sp. dw_435 TaxID=2720081 RepID=UPI001BD5F255|nr:AI-2E family transporter [Glaciihabitans sp. dw_435]
MTRRPYRTGLFLALGALTAITMWNLLGQLATILWCAGLAAFLAIGLHPLVHRLERRGLRRPLAIAAVSASSLVVIGGVLLMILPPLVDQTSSLVAQADDFAATGGLDPVAAHLQQFVPVSMLDVRALFDGLLDGLVSGMTMQTVTSGAMNVGVALGNGVFVTTIVLVLTVYFLAAKRWFSGQFIALLPHDHRLTGIRVISRVGESVGRYFRGQLILALLHGVLSLIILLATGSALPLLFSAIALVAALIPLVGIAASAIVIVSAQALIAPDQPSTWIILAIWYLLYMQLEEYVIAPRIVGRAVAMPDVMIVLVTLIGGSLYGILGALLAVPIAVAAHTVHAKQQQTGATMFPATTSSVSCGPDPQCGMIEPLSGRPRP